MSDREFPQLGYDAGVWSPPKPDVALAEVRAFLGRPEDQFGSALQLAVEDDFDYFKRNVDSCDIHKRVYLCYEKMRENLDPSAPNGYAGGFSVYYCAATVNGITDDRFIGWRMTPTRKRTLEESKGFRTDLTSAQVVHQMVAWCKTKDMETLDELNMFFDGFGCDHEDILNFCKNFKPWRQALWGSLNNNEKPYSSDED